jgi:light-independent protochlorophyllide reductase subunit B
MWTYEGPPHVGAMRVATAMKDVHYVLHAPQGDTYADLLFTMIERLKERPPVTYTTFQARDLGKDTASLFMNSARDAYERFKPNALLVGASCTAELIQDDPGGLAEALNLPVPVVPLELPAYQKKENWGASETFYQLIRCFCMEKQEVKAISSEKTPSCNILGPTALGFRNKDDVKEIRSLLEEIGIMVNVVAPLDATTKDLSKIPSADFNVVLYPEVGRLSAEWLLKKHNQPYTKIIPYGVIGTRAFIKEVISLAKLDKSPNTLSLSEKKLNNSRWYSSSVDSNYLTNKRVFIFGDATHVLSAVTVAKDEFAFEVVGIGTYTREFARDVRALASEIGVNALITDDYLEVESEIEKLQPELILGTQMERHIGKRLGIGSAVISAPMHVQDFPCRFSPQMGYEGANVLFDTWIHSLMMGLEEHLLTMFRDDFEFKDDSLPSHLGPKSENKTKEKNNESLASSITIKDEPVWETEAEVELKKIPFFVRGKAKRNTEKYAVENKIEKITIDTLYDAKAYYAK